MGWDLCLFVEEFNNEFKDWSSDGFDIMEGRESMLMDSLLGAGRYAGTHDEHPVGYRPHFLSPEVRKQYRGMQSCSFGLRAFELKDLVSFPWPDDVSGWWRNRIIPHLRELQESGKRYRLVAWVLM